MIGAIVGQNQDLTYGIATAVYLHGLAGQYVSQQIGEISSKALDIIDSVAMVIKRSLDSMGIRPVWAEVDLAAIKHNFNQVKIDKAYHKSYGYC